MHTTARREGKRGRKACFAEDLSSPQKKTGKERRMAKGERPVISNPADIFVPSTWLGVPLDSFARLNGFLKLHNRATHNASRAHTFLLSGGRSNEGRKEEGSARKGGAEKNYRTRSPARKKANDSAAIRRFRMSSVERARRPQFTPEARPRPLARPRKKCS